MKRILVLLVFCLPLLLNFYPAFAQQGRFRLVATMTGDTIGDQFQVVTNIGDVNADGYDDLMVGGYGGSYVKLFFGGNVWDTIPDMTIRADYPGCWYGHSIAGGKDINGDGCPDFVIGSPYHASLFPPAFFKAGKVDVFFGGPSLDAIPDCILGCAHDYYYFGYSVALGDINGDGFADIIVGASNDDIDGRGRVMIYYGGKEIHATPDVTLEGQIAHDVLGASIAFLGDVDKDGFGDFLVGAPQWDLNGARFKGGSAFLFYGGKEIGYAHSMLITGDSLKPGQFGRVVAALGDINHDGYPDFGISGLASQKIFFGGASIDTSINFRVPGGPYFNFVGGVGDINNDGYDDFLSTTDSLRIFLGGAVPNLQPRQALPYAEPVCRLDNTHNEPMRLACGVVSSNITPGYVQIYRLDQPDAVKGEEGSDATHPHRFRLHSNYPNPFNGGTVIEYDLEKTSAAELVVYNLLGQKVRTLVSGMQSAGRHNVRFDASGLPSGIYLYRLKANGACIQKTMMYLK